MFMSHREKTILLQEKYQNPDQSVHPRKALTPPPNCNCSLKSILAQFF